MSVGQDIQPDSVEAAFLERTFRAKLPRDLSDKLVSVQLVRVNHAHDVFRVSFATEQVAWVPAHKMADDETIAHLCLTIR